MTLVRAVAVSALLAALAACASPPAPTPPDNSPISLALEGIVAGLDQPVFVTAIPGRPELAVVEQTGRILVVADGAVRATALLDVADRITTAGTEQGLLGLAFAPDFATSGHFFVDYTDTSGDTAVERYTAAPGTLAAPASSAVRILSVRQPHSNHNGGMLAFGPHGFLYVAMGDGGSGGDPDNRAQDKRDLLGKILRIDVAVGVGCEEHAACYSIPSSNPFADGREGAPEVWAYGLRNPWRFSFDRETGDLWIGDVGQNAWEEIDFEPAGSAGGVNYGWSAWEGSHRFDPERDAPGAVPPVFDYSQGVAHSCAVTGGYVYRGTAMPALRGTYLFSDYCSGQIWTLVKKDGAWEAGVALETGLMVSSFGEDAAGEVLVVDLGGSVHRIVPA